MTSRPVAPQHLGDLARLRRVRDRIDREYAQPLDVEALARGAHMSAGHLSRQFRLANARDGRGNVYVLTAGHCRDNEPWSGWAGEIGTQVLYASYPTNDYSRIRSTNTIWVPTPKIAGLASVLGKGVAAVGTTVCRSGKTSGVTCGTIESTNQTVTYSLYYGAVYGLTRTTAGASKGDSGGPFISSTRQAQGVLSGGGGYGADEHTFFQPLNEILSAYDLTLVTDPAGSLTN